MRIIDNDIRDPYLNLAIEEYLTKTAVEDCFMLWQNCPSIILGKNQNAYAEINMDYVRKNDVAVVRRITGGGAVYHDEGNINFTFIASRHENKFADFSKFTKPVVVALSKLGITAEFSGRNDLVIDNKKFSGNAQCRLKDNIMHHGTLLFDVDIEALVASLNVNFLKIKTKAVASTRARVTNISEHLKLPMTIKEFKNMLLKEIKNSSSGSRYYELTKEDLMAAESLAKEKYRLKEWTFSDKFAFTAQKEKKFAGGLLQVYTDIKNGMLKEIRFFGDYFSEKDVGEIEKALRNTPYNELAIKKSLDSFDIDLYFKNINKNEILELII